MSNLRNYLYPAMNTIARHLSTVLLAVLPVAAALAQATGGPANFEHQSSPSEVDAIHAKERAQIGSYARYLMVVNGMSEDAALRMARTIDRAEDTATPRYAKAR